MTTQEQAPQRILRLAADRRGVASRDHRRLAAPGTKLPSEGELAERFGVHRNTVRQAVAALAAEHLVVSRRGSGTFIAEHTVLVHRIGARTRLSDSLGRRGRAAGRLLESAIEPDARGDRGPAPLGDRPVLRLETVRPLTAPLSARVHWFAADRVPGLADHLSATGSITAALRAVGIDDYMRAATTVSARHATAAEAADLELPPGSVVLVTRSLDILADGTPLQIGITSFVADRVELDVGHVSLELDEQA